MKFSYSPQLNNYVVTELGRLIDSDDDAEELLLRHGFLCHEPDEATGMFGERSLPDDSIAAAEAMVDALLLEDFGVASNSDDDNNDLAVIRDFLED
jgi:hypothetical protein